MLFTGSLYLLQVGVDVGGGVWVVLYLLEVSLCLWFVSYCL